MSNRVKLESKMEDKHILSETLKSLKIEHEVCEENATIVDYYKSAVTDKASVKISEYVGFEYDNNGRLALVGDTHHERGILANKNSINKIEQVYKAVSVFKTLQNAGYEVHADLDNCVNADSIEVVADVSLGG